MPNNPKVSIHLPTRWGDQMPPIEELMEFCRRADELGFATLWVYDMIFHSVKSLDPLTMLSLAAAHTKRIGLGVNALLLSIRHPVIVAKSIGTLDALAGGRTVLSVAMGGRDNEYIALNAPKTQRAGRLEEGMTVLRKLWSEPNVNFSGRYYTLEDANIDPKPPSHVPLLIGASSVPGMQRAGRIADGWTRGGRGSPEDFARDWQIVTEAAESSGRDPSTLLNCKTLYANVDKDRDVARRELEEHFDAFRNQGLPELKDCVYGTPSDIVDAIRALGDANCQEVALGFPWPDRSKLELVAEHVLPKFP